MRDFFIELLYEIDQRPLAPMGCAILILVVLLGGITLANHSLVFLRFILALGGVFGVLCLGSLAFAVVQAFRSRK